MRKLQQTLPSRLGKAVLVPMLLNYLLLSSPHLAEAGNDSKKGGLRGFMQRLLNLDNGTTTTTSPTQSTAPTLTQSPTSLTFTAMEGGSNPGTQSLNITNTGGGTLSWNAKDDATWLSLSPTSGTTSTAETNVITVSVNTSGLSANTYNATITIAATSPTSASYQIPVSLTVLPPSPTIGKSVASLSFVAMEGGANPTSQSFTITNTGKGTLNWSVTDNAAWLSVSPNSGTTTIESDVVTVSVNSSNLATSTYYGTILITDPAASNNPQQIPVTLAVTAPQSSTAELSWDPNTESDLAGYKVYAGTSSRSYGPPIDVGNVTSFKVINLAKGQTYYFAVTAYNTSGAESGFSNEVSKTIN